MLTNKWQEIIKEAKLNIKKAQEKQKEIYDQKHERPDIFQVGNNVLKKKIFVVRKGLMQNWM